MTPASRARAPVIEAEAVAKPGEHQTKVSLSIVVPAYNEEASIGRTIERTLAASQGIRRESDVDQVALIVVDDGSTDRTADIARRYPSITVISHGINRGYGAALKTGFAAASGDLLGFMDADGTCDPVFFGQLCRELSLKHLGLVVGSRLGPTSKMPWARRVGNRFFAQLVRMWVQRPVEDLASGMRVLRRELYPLLLPLPDGLHFTPAMSCRALLDHRFRIGELPIPYHARIGQSKLCVVRDGVRFLRTIVEIAVSTRPIRLFGLIGASALVAAGSLLVVPVWRYVATGTIREGIIYRLLAVMV